jgi:type IV secretory pathway VirB2 component (pilin)|tara:strand:- start:170 stop:319 length:150 start_codon:yes stop_codon:yes gene_type:complete
MQHNRSRGIQVVSLMILGGTLLFDLPLWFGLIGFVLGIAGLFMTDKRAG